MSDLKIDWNIIFNLREFIICLDFNTLKEFSLLSIQVRNKLKHLLFDRLLLLGYKFKDYFERNNLVNSQIKLITDYAEYLKNHWEIVQDEDKCNQVSENNSEFDILVRELNDSFSKLSKYTTSLKTDILAHTFYALYPAIFSLYNLTQLYIENCSIPLLILINIGKHLKHLKSLSLCFVNIIELAKQQISASSTEFPDSLQELEIYRCQVQLFRSNPIISKLIRTTTPKEATEPSYLLAFTLKNLKKLNLGFINDSYIERLLFQNPNVEELIIKEESARQEDFIKISTMERLKKLTLLDLESNNAILKSFYFDTQVPKFNFVKILKLEFIHDTSLDLDIYYDILVYFPNLKELELDLSYFDFNNSNINNFLKINLKSSSSLDVLSLYFIRIYEEYDSYWSEYYNDIEWCTFINVKCLVLELKSLKVSDIDFTVLPRTLQEIIFKSSDIKKDLKWIEDNIEKLNWDIKYEMNVIRFIK
ncbi:hypothetical protein CONCODRAFT_169125 [Conidiobolus coronatus NRRL 28638]|uniref:F-box/LRR-repeat protein 15/At3g58940/PEG3-like LRR domain-containing protein n=1 Tax=Conidiobolus coronatus (strain ATCC 28846 / CBS 209.66 / NRRL 28638) TaxID=796925 RepID=A0A137NSQ9_CONC2|nr:hypothetical protein CONCODRAFT_169125 [Conidiobolus coronatus NRRL 28638]|eukprot:KXN65732.1 hypothetical protein CONCODRAFT_169125 [Conidiobolus coronatus NRRL 28638]